MLNIFALHEQNIPAVTWHVWDRLQKGSLHSAVLPQQLQKKGTTTVNLHVLQKNACACYKYAKTTAERSFLILDQKCPFLLGGCSQEPSVTVAKTKLISFFSPDNCHQTGISETYYSLSRRHLEPGLAQTLLFKRKVKKTDSTSK